MPVNGNGQWRIWAIVAGAAINMMALVGVGVIGYLWVSHSRAIEVATQSAMAAHEKVGQAQTQAAVKDEQLRHIDRRLSNIEGALESMKTTQSTNNDRLASISARVDAIGSTTSKHAQADSDLAVQVARAILDQQRMLQALGLDGSQAAQAGKEHP